MAASRLRAASLLSLALGASGCALLLDDSWRYEKPLIAVASFENRARSPFDWSLGDGIAQLLTNALYETEQFRVLDREDLDRVLEEQDLQRDGRTRPEQRVPAGRLKNAHYLVTGVVTEFANVSYSGFDLGIGWFRLGSGGNYAVVNFALKVVEVESGEVVYSGVAGGKVYSGDLDVRTTYKDLTIGAQQFAQTPLGEALQEALDEAVEGIRDRIGRRLWHPVIASVDGDRIVVTGGEDRRLEVGTRWIVRERGEAIVDPTSGDILGHHPGAVVGRVRITDVADRYSLAILESGEGVRRGQRLEREEPSAGSLESGDATGPDLTPHPAAPESPESPRTPDDPGAPSRR